MLDRVLQAIRARHRLVVTRTPGRWRRDRLCPGLWPDSARHGKRRRGRSARRRAPHLSEPSFCRSLICADAVPQNDGVILLECDSTGARFSMVSRMFPY